MSEDRRGSGECMRAMVDVQTNQNTVAERRMLQIELLLLTSLIDCTAMHLA